MVQHCVREELESRLEQTQTRLLAIVEHTTALRKLRRSRDELRNRIQAAIERVENSAITAHQELNRGYRESLPADE
jgi:predicted nucleic acid-binding protein